MYTYTQENEDKVITSVIYKGINLYKYENNDDTFVLINGKKVSIKEFRESK